MRGHNAHSRLGEKKLPAEVVKRGTRTREPVFNGAVTSGPSLNFSFLFFFLAGWSHRAKAAAILFIGKRKQDVGPTTVTSKHNV